MHRQQTEDSDQILPRNISLYAIHESMHPSIFSHLCSSVSRGAHPSFYGKEAGYTLNRLSIFCRDRQLFTLTLTPTANFESSVNLACMSLVYVRKPDYLKRTHAGIDRAYSTLKGPASQWFKTQGITVLTTVSLCHTWN